MQMRPVPLDSPQARALAVQMVRDAPDGKEVVIRAPSKKRAQEEAYHAMFGEIAKQCKHLNQCFDAEGWKRLLLDQFRTDTLALPDLDDDVRADLINAVKMVPSLDGRSIVSIGLQSRTFRRKTAAMLLDWLNAYGAEHDVKFKAPEWREDDQ